MKNISVFHFCQSFVRFFTFDGGREKITERFNVHHIQNFVLFVLFVTYTNIVDLR